MVGSFVAPQSAELIFQAWLREMDDRRLESEALTWIWLSESHNSKPWDEEQWRRDCVRRGVPTETEAGNFLACREQHSGSDSKDR